MDLGEFYPGADELIKHEMAVLQHLRNDPYIKDKHSQVATHAAQYLAKGMTTRSGLEFFSWLDVSHGQRTTGRRAIPNIRLVLGAVIERQGLSYGNVSYCLAVCKTPPSLAILRKFHFDIVAVAGPTQGRRQPHPRCHLQYGGTMIPEMVSMGIRPTQLVPLHPSLSEPRIFSWPMSLALLFDLALREFPDARSRQFRGAPEWRSIVRSHEAALLRPFFDKCLQLMRNRDALSPTLADAFYVD